MTVMIVDDERLAIRQFQMEIEEIGGIEIAGAFTNPLEALEFAKENPVRAAFLDIEMPAMNGLMLAQKLREIYPKIVIVFVTGYEQYAMEAFRMKADFYLTKPYNRKDIEDVLERARLLAWRQRKRVFLRTFGNFDMFVDGEVVHFNNTKAKELLALCVDKKGGSVTIWEATDKLWEGRTYDDRVKNLYRKAVMCLRQTFSEYGLTDIFFSSRGECSIDWRKVDCDYYRLLEGNRDARIQWNMSEEYMSDYSWAEKTCAVLLNLRIK